MKISFHFEFRIIVQKDGGSDMKIKEVNNRNAPAPEQQPTPCASFLERARQEIERQKPQRSGSTIDNYRTALRSFCRFLVEGHDGGTADGKAGSPSDSTDALTPECVKSYERWLRDQRLSLNTVSCYMRSLRSLAVKVCGEEAKACFQKVYTGRPRTDKRAIQEEDINRLRALRLKRGSFLCLVRDLFLFSFYALGMPFVDVAFLRKSQISDGQLVYHRHKTGQRIIVHLEPCMEEIINRYRTEGREYVFPLLKSNEVQRSYAEYRQMLNRYNRSLKVLAVKAKLEGRLTSYVARHTWASVAFNANVGLPVISKALGHSNPQNTLIYIRQIDDHRLDEANKSILRGLSEDKSAPPLPT